MTFIINIISVNIDNTMDNLVSNFNAIDLSAYEITRGNIVKSSAQVVWHYLDIGLFPGCFVNTIDWEDNVVHLNPDKLVNFINIKYVPGISISQPLDEIINSVIGGGMDEQIPSAPHLDCKVRITKICEYFVEEGFAKYFPDAEINEKYGMNPKSVLVVPLAEGSMKIHMGMITLNCDYYKKLGMEGHKIIKYNKIIDLVTGFRNHLSITGTIIGTGLNILRCIFEEFKKRICIEYIMLDDNLEFSIPLIQIISNAYPYFPELQVIWITPGDGVKMDADDDSKNKSHPRAKIPIADVDKLLLQKKPQKIEKRMQQYNIMFKKHHTSRAICFKNMFNNIKNHHQEKRYDIIEKVKDKLVLD